MRTCTNIALADGMRSIVFTIKAGRQTEEITMKLPEKPFKGGDFRPSTTTKVLDTILEAVYPGMTEQVELFKRFRTEVRNNALLINSSPARFRDTLEGLHNLIELGQQITPEGEEAYLFYRSALMKMNSFASGSETDELPEVVQARREAYEQKKAETGKKNIFRAVETHKANHAK